jgi:FeS assembly protein IscX
MRWTDIEDIAELLEEKHPNEDIINLRFTNLHKWILELNDFKDAPSKSNEKILEAIQGKWIELRNEGK